MEGIQLIKVLSEAFGVAGFEDEVREKIRELLSPVADDIQVDVLGNLIGIINPGSPFTVMLDAHMDEIGFIISHIDDEGFLRFAKIGGWDERILPAQPVVVRTRNNLKLYGTVGSIPPHIQDKEQKKRPLKLEELFIDIGAASGEDARKRGVSVGDPAVLSHSFKQLDDLHVMGKAFDDRAGCAILVKVMEYFHGRKPDFTLVANFSVSEEVGLRGARAAAYSIQPRIAVAVEGTVGADVPGVASHLRPALIGKGPAITVADKSIIVPSRLVRSLEAIAEEAGIPWQVKKPLYGGTDAGAIQLSRSGTLAAVISVPCRYIHSPASIMRLDDFENTLKLVIRFVENSRMIYERLSP